jgi:hypothetical protein
MRARKRHLLWVLSRYAPFEVRWLVLIPDTFSGRGDALEFSRKGAANGGAWIHIHTHSLHLVLPSPISVSAFFVPPRYTHYLQIFNTFDRARLVNVPLCQILNTHAMALFVQNGNFVRGNKKTRAPCLTQLLFHTPFIPPV